MNNFIVANYPNIPLNDKIKGYAQLTRPFTVVAAFLVTFSIYIYACLYYGVTLNWVTAFTVGLSLSCVQAFGQVMNQCHLTEIEIDRINGKTYRPLVSGLISSNEGMGLGILYLLMGIFLGFSVTIMFGTIVLILAFLAFFYTFEPFRFKNMFIINNLVQAISRGFLPFVAVFLIFRFDVVAVFYGLTIMFWVFGAQTTKDFCDVEGDKTFGVKTFPVVLGKRAKTLIFVFTHLSMILLVVGVITSILPMYYILSIMIIIPTYLILFSLYKKSPTENNLAWMIFYVTLAFWTFIPLVGIILFSS